MPKAYGTPGPRAIYPDICTSRDLAACSIDAQLLFDRLIAQADDQGRLEGNPGVIRALCVPLIEEHFTARRVGACLRELVAANLITLYAVDHLSHLVQLRTWWRWQAGQRRAYPSRWPAPPDWTDPVYGHGAPGPTTYRQAVGIDPYERPKDGGNSAPNSAGNSALTRAPAQPLPVPSAGASAGASASADVEIPPPPAERGRRSTSSNPRAAGTSPRQTGHDPRTNGTSPRQVRADEKRFPTALGAIMAEAARREREVQS